MNDGFFAYLERAKSERRDRIHALHRYWGKLVPAIPRAAIAAYSRCGQVVGDPFCGSGTTLVEVRLAGRDGWGRDLNPLAVAITRAKTGDLDPAVLESELATIGHRLAAAGEAAVPYCANVEHWFRPEVVRDLGRVRAAVRAVVDDGARSFFEVCLSAVVREVSNADPRHVFPGYSKRMRALDAAGRQVDAVGAFLAGARRRVRAYAAYRRSWPRVGRAGAEVGDARRGLPPCDLMVTNPPYLGAIRYLETMKLELYWLGLVASHQQYLGLDRQVLATERFYHPEYRQWESAGHPDVDAVSQEVYAAGHAKMSLVISRYFQGTRAFLDAAAASIRCGGHLVVKISDTYIRALTVPTHRLWCDLAAGAGFTLVHCRPDGYRARSLSTRRNTYSRTIPHDYLLVFRRGPRPTTTYSETGLRPLPSDE